MFQMWSCIWMSQIYSVPICSVYLNVTQICPFPICHIMNVKNISTHVSEYYKFWYPLFIFYLNITNIIYPVYKGYTYFLSAFALYLYVTNISNTHSSCIWMLDISSPLSSCIWILPILSSPSIMCWNITNIPSSHCH